MSKMGAIQKDTRALIERGIIPDKLKTVANLQSFMFVFNTLHINGRADFFSADVAEYFRAYGFSVIAKGVSFVVEV